MRKSSDFVLTGVGAVVATSLVAGQGSVAAARPGDVESNRTSDPVARQVSVVDSEDWATFVAVAKTGTAVLENPQVSLPKSAGGRIEVRSQFGGQDLSVEMPDGLRASADDDADRSAHFENPADSFDITVQSVETGARALVSVNGADAPSEYAFEIGSDSPIELVKHESGAVEVLDELGEAVGHVEPPWAVDANGDLVPTEFRVDGTTLVQVVDHKDAAYPVVADPAVQSDCGWVTCTIRFDRDRTHFIGWSGQSVSGIATAVCAFATGGVGAAACIAAINAVGWVVSSRARDYYNNGNCFGVRYGATVTHATQVNEGTYNCHK